LSAPLGATIGKAFLILASTIHFVNPTEKTLLREVLAKAHQQVYKSLCLPRYWLNISCAKLEIFLRSSTRMDKKNHTFLDFS